MSGEIWAVSSGSSREPKPLPAREPYEGPPRLTRARLVQIFSLFALLASVSVSGLLAGRYVARTEWQATSLTEEHVRQWIMEKNPAATMREFEGFPRTLLNASARWGIDYRVVMALIEKESEWRPRAVGKAGECGLMQILPSTAAGVVKRLAEQGEPIDPALPSGPATCDPLFDPKTNIRIGIAYLAQQVHRYGMGPTALQAYNRNPDKAAEVRPGDRYAAEVALKFLALVQWLWVREAEAQTSTQPKFSTGWKPMTEPSTIAGRISGPMQSNWQFHVDRVSRRVDVYDEMSHRLFTGLIDSEGNIDLYKLDGTRGPRLKWEDRTWNQEKKAAPMR